MKVFLTCPKCQKVGIVDVWYMKDVTASDRSFRKTFLTGDYIYLKSFKCKNCQKVFWACADNYKCENCHNRIDCLAFEQVVKVGVVPVETTFEYFPYR